MFHFLRFACLKNGETKTAVFGPFVYVIICKELGFLKEARSKRCHTTVSKLQRNGCFVLKRYKDAKNYLISSNSGKRRLCIKGK